MSKFYCNVCDEEVTLENEPIISTFESIPYVNKYNIKGLTWGEVLAYGTWGDIKNDYAW